jgi:hypothetical protein
MKLCKKCLTETTSFNKDKSRPDGLQAYCRPCSSAIKKRHYLENKERVLAKNAANAHKYSETPEQLRAKYSRYKKRHPDRVNARNRLRSARKINATPPWLTEEHKTQMAEKYWLARDLQCVSGEQYHVDHIIPLKGKDVCGLHVPWNLQVLPAYINLAKSNKTSPKEGQVPSQQSNIAH